MIDTILLYLASFAISIIIIILCGFASVGCMKLIDVLYDRESWY